ncbi:M15 family metallopeptidase [uncultured Helicobacter sp.]|uniref:M15 family metallopeptidase n=1 Tax=uncultured Helicobacter sp. TaxID=175537 RepID=UPI00260D5C68|nr:M15 family metallopeptidase [uncultured Helicobacter sp.]
MSFKAIFSSLLITQVFLNAESQNLEIPKFNPQIATHCLLKHYNGLEIDSQNILRFHNNQALSWDLEPKDTNLSTKLAYQNALKNPNLADSFAFPYPLGNFAKMPYQDSSRIRDISLFFSIYGANEAEVKQHLKSLVWLDGTEILFNTQNGAYDALERVRNHLAKHIKSNPNLKIYLNNIGGTFKWRKIANSPNLSAHSFGIAIDINVSNSRYWLWDLKNHLESDSKSIAMIPLEIIESFERENFIWGGRWWHYDTMHFEYRPEILCYAREISKL